MRRITFYVICSATVLLCVMSCSKMDGGGDGGGGKQGEIPAGALPGKFTVNSDGKQVYFSKGNLQFHTTDKIWRFAEHQYDLLDKQTDDQSGRRAHTTSDYAENSGKWIDLLGWGTSGYNHGAVCYQPWSTSWNSDDYYAYGELEKNLYDNNGQADWGYNKISNGGDKENSGWRTLSWAEWEYLIGTSTKRKDKYKAFVQIEGTKGFVIAPDDFEGVINSSYTISEWSEVEHNSGLVFLPVAGQREKDSVSGIGDEGTYWSNNKCDDVYAAGFHFSYVNKEFAVGGAIRYLGVSIRLVADTEQAPSTHITTNPASAFTSNIGGSDSFTYFISDSRTGASMTARSDVDWITNVKLSNNIVSYTIAENSSAESRKGCITLTYGTFASYTFVVKQYGTASCPEDALPGKFSVSDTLQVYFSKGNLQAICTAEKAGDTPARYSWAFAANQYDFVGDTMGNTTIDNQRAGGIVDLFGWSTSKTNYGISSSVSDSDYSGDFSDWGLAYSKSKGITPMNTWRTLTGASGEWNYLFNSRTMKYKGKPRYSNKIYGVTIEGRTYKGLFIYPDDYNGVEIGTNNAPDTWAEINAMGIVFLPAAGRRRSSSVSGVGEFADYWSSTPADMKSVYIVGSYPGGVYPMSNDYRYNGNSVRLVTECQ